MIYLLQLLDWLVPGLQRLHEVRVGIASLIAGLAVITFPALLVLLFNWLERKVAAHMQVRLGPMRVGGWHGWLQSIADGVKLLMKEDIIPRAADKPLFILAPFVVFAGSAAAWATIPWARTVWPADLNIGILYVVAISGLVVPGIILAGWASSNKWALFGAMRGAAQIVSYEVPAAICIVVIATVTGSLSLVTIAEMQRGGIWHWNAFRFESGLGLLLFPLLVVYYLSTLAETNRTPFDIPEAESELVAGYHTEYSGMRFAFFYLAEYANMFLVGCTASLLFLGGYNSALPDRWAVPGPWTAAIFFVLLAGFVAFYFVAERVLRLTSASPLYRVPGYLFGLAAVATVIAGSGPVALIGKGLLVVFLQMWHRWTFPRLRVDQLMAMSWKYLLPITFAILLAVSTLVMLGPSPRERWEARKAAMAGAAAAPAPPAPAAGAPGESR